MKMSMYKLISIFIFFAFNTLVFAEADQNSKNNINDKEIVAEVNKKINADPILSPYHFDISAKDGIVTINGKVNSDSEAAEAIELAESTQNVKDIDTSKLSIETSTQPLTDMIITAKIKGLFIREKIFGTKNIPLMNINVETNNGVVYLAGIASDKKQITDAISLAKSVKDVKNVVPKIKINDEEIDNKE